MRILEIGGSLAGFQFVLSKLGMQVVNLDPGEEVKPRGKCWPLSLGLHSKLNRSFGTSVTLRKCFIEEAAFADASFDRIFAISVLEHIPQELLSLLVACKSRTQTGRGISSNRRPFLERQTVHAGTI